MYIKFLENTNNRVTIIKLLQHFELNLVKRNERVVITNFAEID